MIKLLIVFEGLGLGFSPFLSSGYVERYLAAPLKTEYKIDYEVHGWMETSVPCKPGSMAVGHSYGGRAALLYAERCKTKAIILDDRPPIFARCTSETKREVTAFYREGFMRGCAVKGAKNVKLPSSVGHVQVPLDHGVKWEVRRLMGLL